MNKTFTNTLLAAATGLLLVGCATESHYVEPGGSRLVVNHDKINVQDFANAADTMVQSLIDNLIKDLGKVRHT